MLCPHTHWLRPEGKSNTRCEAWSVPKHRDNCLVLCSCNSRARATGVEDYQGLLRALFMTHCSKLPLAAETQTLPSVSVGVRGHESSKAALAWEYLLIMREQEGQEKVWLEGRTSPLPAPAVHPASILSSHCAGLGCQKRLGFSAQDVQGAKAKP